MERKLLVVHPHEHYDTQGLTRDAIQTVASAYPSSNLFVLRESRSPYCRYLGRNSAHILESAEGALLDQGFIDRLMEGCDELAVIGHTGDTCHRRSIESVIREFRASSLPGLSLVIPTYAVSSRQGRDTGWTIAEEILQQSYHQDSLHLHHRYGQFWQGIEGSLSREERAALNVLRNYVLHAAVFCDTTVIVDRRAVLRHPQEKKRLHLQIETVASRYLGMA